MQERIVNIILYLVNELKSNKRLSDVDVTSLTRNGYTQSEISSAFSWLFERLSAEQDKVVSAASPESSYRLLNDFEKMIIDPQAYGYLIQCQQLGLIKNADVETIIERIVAAGIATIELADMKSLVAGHLFETDSARGKVSLGMNDTIH